MDLVTARSWLWAAAGVAVVAAALLWWGSLKAAVVGFRFTVPAYDNSGTCEAPVADSSQALTPIRAVLVYERTVHTGGRPITAVLVDTMLVERGMSYDVERSLEPDTFTVTVKLCDWGGCGCPVRREGWIVKKSVPGTPTVVRTR